MGSLSNASLACAMQAIGCVGARMCNSNNCPAGFATQKPELRARLDVAEGAQRLARYMQASVELMQVMARACGHDNLADFSRDDLGTWQESIARLSGIAYVGYGEFDGSESSTMLNPISE